MPKTILAVTRGTTYNQIESMLTRQPPFAIEFPGGFEMSTESKSAGTLAGEILGVQCSNVADVVAALGRGLDKAAIKRFQTRSQLSWSTIKRVVQPTYSTKTSGSRRRTTAYIRISHSAQRLTPQASERLYRLARIFDQAVELFDGDEAAARNWLKTPRDVFAQKSPLEMAATEYGARQVEDLIGRLEHGVFS